MTEEWRDIPGYHGYQVSSEARIRNAKGCIFKPYLRPDGRRQFHIALGKRHVRKKMMVYQAVALAFLGAPPSGMNEVNHIDGRLPTNDKPENLEWTNRKGNVAHAVKMSLNSTRRFAVIGTAPDGSKVQFRSQRHAEVALSGKASSAVHHCLIGKKKSAYGYVWSRA
jgi:NUMOD4 motif